MAIQLRDYQVRDIQRTRNAFREHKRVLYVSPTGSGKTTLFSEIVRLALERGGRVLVVVHRKELVRQVSNRLGVFGIEHGVIAGGYKRDLDRRVQVCMVRRAPKLLSEWQPTLVVVDEAHHSVAGSWEATLQAAPNAKVLGVTATPCRLDGRGLGDCYDMLVVGPTVKELTRDGYLVPAEIYAPNEPDMGGAKSRGGDWQRSDAVAAMERSSITGDAVEHYKKLCAGARAIAFCVDVEHARRTAAAFNDAGIPADVILGEQDDDERDRVVADLESGRIRVLVSVDVVSEGFDIPAVECAILLRPTKSLSLFLQQVGRALRPAEGKTHAVILDHAGNVLRHGFPDDDFQWSLDKGVRRARPSDLLSVHRCPECFGVYRAGQKACPYCGHVQPAEAKRRKLEERNGELAKLTPELREALREEKERREQARREQDKLMEAELKGARTRGEVIAVYKKYGRSAKEGFMRWKKSPRRQAEDRRHKQRMLQF